MGFPPGAERLIRESAGNLSWVSLASAVCEIVQGGSAGVCRPMAVMVQITHFVPKPAPGGCQLFAQQCC